MIIIFKYYDKFKHNFRLRPPYLLKLVNNIDFSIYHPHLSFNNQKRQKTQNVWMKTK